MSTIENPLKRPDDPEAVREMVRAGYTDVAERASSCCSSAQLRAEESSRSIGYSQQQLETVPEGANLGVGCGNPTAIDSLSPGEVVVDLGSGAGMDAFLAAAAVGDEGRVIGVDMTDAMLEKARVNAEKAGVGNVEFRKGNIEALPLEDQSVDVIISNCVINLSPEKEKVFAEAFRVLKPGGRIMVSDVILEHALPEQVLQTVDAYIGCVGGASVRSKYFTVIADAGFVDLEVIKESCFADSLSMDDPMVTDAIDKLGVTEEQARGFLKAVTSVSLLARKPAAV